MQTAYDWTVCGVAPLLYAETCQVLVEVSGALPVQMMSGFCNWLTAPPPVTTVPAGHVAVTS